MTTLRENRVTRPGLRSSGVSNNRCQSAPPSSHPAGLSSPPMVSPADGAVKVSEFYSDRFIQHRPIHNQVRRNVKRALRVMKFGGTSVGDASCIRRVVEIILGASRESNLVVVVSAMSGVTNNLIEVAKQAETGDTKKVAEIFEELRNLHCEAASALIRSTAERNRITRRMQRILEEGAHLCRCASPQCKLTPHAHDSIASLGERLSALLLAAALAQ